MRLKWYMTVTRVRNGNVITFNKYWVLYQFVKAKIKRFFKINY